MPSIAVRLIRRELFARLLFGLFATAVVLAVEEPVPGPGTRLPLLAAGATTYQDVQIRSVNSHTVVFTHRGGMASIPLRTLAPEWQARFHYDPAADVATERAAAPAPRPAAHPKPPTPASSFDEMLRQFGQVAPVRAEVDLRPKFFKQELGVKNQGYRPSCAIFAVISALEFQNAEYTGRAEKFSEEYVIWAVRRSTNRVTSVAAADGTIAEGADEGFALGEVVSAIRTYGVPLQSSMPNTFGSKITAIEDPPPAIIDEARRHERVSFHPLPGRDNPTRINNLVIALNAGLPVPVGLAWPHYRTLRTGYLSGQTPLEGAGHAVTIVGYRCASGRLADAVFIFKNSWGPTWGQGGYGTVTYDYLAKHLYDALLLELQPVPAG